MIELTAEQQRLVDLVAGDHPPRVVCLTGGPGTGKTSTIRELVRRLRARGRTVALAAPSGKAAQRVAQSMEGEAEASTIHRLLRMRPEAYEHEPLLGTDVLVLDEASMIDTQLMASVLAASFEGGGRVRTVVLVGDADQLPPVGPGQPFVDLLAARAVDVPTVRLTVIQRQEEASGIVLAAHAIQRGEEPEWRDDFQLVEVDALGDVPGACLRVYEEQALRPETSQVLAPQRTTKGGVDAINEAFETRRESRGELLRGKFRVGTKAINVKNDYTLGVFNGEVGFVVGLEAGAAPAKDMVEVEFGGTDARRVVYRGAQLGMLQPAWALTCHKSQGSEYDAVVVVAHKGHSYMLTRSLLYVAVTRARSRVVVVGQRAAVVSAVRKVADLQRRTLLQRWLGVDKAPGEAREEEATCRG